jgi:predicted alpha/beta superfamily hydrolase
MIKILTLITTVIGLLCSNLAFSSPFNMGERIQIQSDVLNEMRHVQILLPENYHDNKNATYPVIYLLDGDFSLHGVSGMLDFLANKGQVIPDVILVAIADKGTDVYRQYMTPESLSAPFKPKDKGKAEYFLKFLTQELKPYINKHYRAADNNILVGGSIGGLFVFNALLEAPEAFEHFVSISPSIWLNDHAIMVKAKKVLTQNQHKNTALHLALGDEGRQGVFGLVQLLDELQPKNIQWQFLHYPDENHNSVGLVALRASLKDIFKGWKLSATTLANEISAEQLVAHYKKISMAYNVNQAIPTPSIKSAVRYFYRDEQQDKLADFINATAKALPASEQAFIMMQASYVGHFDSSASALKILKKSESRFDYSIEYLKAIALTYAQLNNVEQAKNYYLKALALAKANKSNQWQINIIEAKLIN